MTNPFPYVGGPFAGEPRPLGFGFGPQERRALHEHRRQARREFRDYVRGNDAGATGRSGPASDPVSAEGSALVSVPSASARAHAVDGAVAPAGAADAVTSVLPSWCCSPSDRCTATR